MGDNRFSEMLKQVREAAPLPSPATTKPKKRPVDFGASLDQDPLVESVFQRLHGMDTGTSEDESTSHSPHARKPENRSQGPSTIQSSIQTTIHSFENPSDKPSDHSNDHSFNHSTIQPFAHSNEHPDNHSINHTFNHSNNHSAIHANNPYAPLAPNQGRLLLYLLNGTGVTNVEIICAETSIACGTVKSALRTLVKSGYIMAKERYFEHSFRGFRYVLNHSRCVEYANRIGADTRSSIHSINHSINHSMNHSPVRSFDNSIIHSPPPISSSSEKPTTTILSGPEMMFWIDAGLSERQAATWCSEFEIAPEGLRQQLAWARWDILENGKDPGNAVSWFFGALRKTGGCYTRPENYQTPFERRQKEMEIEAKRLAEVRLQLQEAEEELEFQRMMNDPDGDLHQACFRNLGELAKSMRGRGLEAAMREQFRKIREGVGV